MVVMCKGHKKKRGKKGKNKEKMYKVNKISHLAPGGKSELQLAGQYQIQQDAAYKQNGCQQVYGGLCGGLGDGGGLHQLGFPQGGHQGLIEE